MKANIHPKLHKCEVTDLSSGKSFYVMSTKEEIKTEVTYLTHPFYTGKHRIVDTENLVKKYNKKIDSINKEKVESKRSKRLKRKSSKVSSIESKEALTLKDMFKSV